MREDFNIFFYRKAEKQQIFTCPKSTIEKLERGVYYVQS